MGTGARDLPAYRIPPPLPPIAALILILVLDLVAPRSFFRRRCRWGRNPAVGRRLGLSASGIASPLKLGESPYPFKPTERLLTAGALQISRNPIYAGGTIGLLGLALLLDTATGVAVVALPAIGARNLAVTEERYLEARRRVSRVPLTRSPLDLASRGVDPRDRFGRSDQEVER